MKIELIASLQGAKCVCFDDDGSSMVKLTMDGSEIANAVKLLTLKGKTFTVKIDTEAR